MIQSNTSTPAKTIQAKVWETIKRYCPRNRLEIRSYSGGLNIHHLVGEDRVAVCKLQGQGDTCLQLLQLTH